VYTQNIVRLSILDQLKNNVSKILVIIFVVYSLTILFLYQHYTEKISIEKSTILKDYYNNIVKITKSEIDSLLQKLSINLRTQKFLVKTNINDLEICNEKCINYNLFQFGAVIDQYIPGFIHYKIELNKNFLYANFNVENYQMEKTYHLNKDHQFNISLSIEDVYWDKVKKDMLKPFWIATLFAMVNSLLFYILTKISFRKFSKTYSLYYQNQYQEKIKSMESSLMNKIWNLNFNKQKDLEINCLLAQEANRLALISENSNDKESKIKNCKLRNSSDKMPCSIVLYQQDKIEEINVEQLISLFADRFDQEDEDISVKLISQVKVVYFVSKAALYQIIYSVISYLIFVINKQSVDGKHNIRVLIDNVGENIRLNFEYDGLPITEEKELLKISGYFFKEHANPFLLNINQIFNILRTNGFDCNISHNQCNVLEILPKEQKNNPHITTQDNIIFLSSILKKRNETN
jgi:hypothetical protein